MGDFLGIKVSAYKRYVTLKILSARFADSQILEEKLLKIMQNNY